MQSDSMIAILILAAFLAVVVAVIMSIVAVAVCVAYIHRDKPDEELQESYDNAKAMETEALAIVEHHQEESEAFAKNAADKVRRAAAEAYVFGMAVCTEIITARNLPPTALPQWDATKFYNHRLSHEVEVCRDSPNMSGALLEKAVDARVRDDLWHWAPKSPATAVEAPAEPPRPENVTRKLGKPEWSDINPNGGWPVKPGMGCAFPGCPHPRAVGMNLPLYCRDHYAMLDGELADAYKALNKVKTNENGYVPGDEQEQVSRSVTPRKPVDAREAMMFGDTKE